MLFNPVLATWQVIAFYRLVSSNIGQDVLQQSSFNDPGDFVENFLSLVCVTKACTRFEYNFAREPGKDRVTSDKEVKANQAFVFALSEVEPVSIESIFENHHDTTDVPKL